MNEESLPQNSKFMDADVTTGMREKEIKNMEWITLKNGEEK